MPQSQTKKPTKAEIARRVREAGERAKAEADARRAAEAPVERPAELGGRNGPEPTRYGDWEKKGIISDF
ncbi:MAG TPA: DUF1674 domain-containing protein [Rhizomicrobium sp.]|jgi:hypothetical protein|nr:DUF1674 domain-containing protein [Rhizomicrobium sp.]